MQYDQDGKAVTGGFDTITDFSVAEGDKLGFADGTLADSTLGLTASTTFYASVEHLLLDAGQHLANYQKDGAIFAGQVGRDVYVSSIGDGGISLLKLENTSVLDLSAAQFTGLTGEVLYSGNGTVADDPFGDNLLGASNPLQAVYLRGQESNDVISDSLLADILNGGIGGDDIHLSGGHDTLVVASSMDSNLGSWFSDETPRSFDIVDTTSHDAFTFDFGVQVHGVGSGVMQKPEDGSFAAVFVAITAAYNTAASSAGDAVLMTIEGHQYLIVDDGDSVISGEDLAIQIVGSGSIALDGFGNMVYSPAGVVETGGGSGGGIPGG